MPIAGDSIGVHGVLIVSKYFVPPSYLRCVVGAVCYLTGQCAQIGTFVGWISNTPPLRFSGRGSLGRGLVGGGTFQWGSRKLLLVSIKMRVAKMARSLCPTVIGQNGVQLGPPRL